MNVREDLKAYIDGELSEERAAAVREALASDPALQQEAAFYEGLSRSIKSHAADFDVRGVERVLERTAQPRLGFLSALGRRRLVASGLVGVLAIIALGVVLDGAVGGGQDSAAEVMGVEGRGVAADQAKHGSSAQAAAPAEGREDFSYFETGPARTEGPALASPEPGEGNQDRYRVQVDNIGGLHSNKLVVPDGALIIRNASLSLESADVRRTHDEAVRLAKAAGGYVGSAELYGTERVTGSLTLRVPVRKLDETLERLRGLGKVVQESSDSQDVTAEHADIGARLKALRAEEQGYVEMLASSRRVTDSLEIRERLSAVRQSIESLESQRAVMKDQAAMSTIALTLTTSVTEKKKVSKAWSQDAWDTAVAGVTSTGRSLARALIFAFVYLPFWAPVFVGLAWAWRRWRPVL